MKKLLALFAFLIPSIMILAQTQDSVIIVPPPLGPDATVTDFVNLYSGLQAAITIILGYLHNYIPGLNQIKSKWIRIILIGVVAAVPFVVMDLNSAIGVVLVFLNAVGFYEIIFKRIQPSQAVKSPKADTV